MIWIVLGIALGVAGAFCIMASELLRAFPKLDTWRAETAVGFAVLGVVVWLVGKIRAGARPRPLAEEQANISTRLGLPFWGAMLMVLAGIVMFIQPLRRQEVALTPAPASPPASLLPPATALPAVTNKPNIFPPLKIQGFILVGTNPVVLINGEAFGVGDRLLGLTVKSVTREGALMEMGSETKLYKVP
jgi:hypothetical protein